MNQIVCPKCGEHVNILTDAASMEYVEEPADAYHARRFTMIDRACPIHRCDVVDLDLRIADVPQPDATRRQPLSL